MGVKPIRTKYGTRWLCRWTKEDGDDAKKLMPRGATKEEALDFLRDQQVRVARIKAGLEVRDRNPHGLTVADVAKRWLKSKDDEKLENAVTNHIVNGAIGTMRLEKATSDKIGDFLDELQPIPPKEGRKPRTTKLSAQTRNHIRKYLLGIFEHAREKKLFIGENPVAEVAPKVVRKKDLDVYTEEQCARLVNAVQQPWRGILALSLHALRKGEVWGLDVVDIDLERDEIHVRRSHSKPYPKSGRARVVPIIPALRPAIAEAVEMAKGRSVPLFAGRDPDAKEGELLTKRRNPRAAVEVPYRRAIKLAKIERVIRFHDLRHTTATLLLRAGVPIAHVSKILGHSSIAITMDTYGHLVVDDLRAEMAKLKFELPAPRAVKEG